jgi:hypothetical protein
LIRTFLAGAVAAVALTGAAVVGVATPAGASTPPACKGALIHVTHSRGEGAAGHANVILRFRNISQNTCTMHGYPGVDALRANGSVLRHAKRKLNGYTGGASSVKTIVLKPNHVASADLEWLNFNGSTGGSCKFSKSIAVTPANTKHTVHFKVSVSKCRLQIHPTVKGRTGNS